MSVSEWILVNGENLQFILFFTLLLVLGTAERWIPKRPGPMERPIRWPVNYLLTVVNLAALGLLPMSFIGAASWAEDRGWGLLHVVQWPAAVVVAVTLLVRAFISVFTHYLNHMVPLFWRVHRVHHLDTELDVSTAVRFHPLEFVIGILPGVPIVVSFGLSPWVLMFYEVLDAGVNIWSHSNVCVPERLDRVLRYIVVTPDLHRLHHSAWKPETNSNFGAVFSIWDLVFGTFRATPRERHEQMRLGLDEVRGRDAQRALWLLTSVLDRSVSDNRLSRHSDRSRGLYGAGRSALGK